MLGSPIYMVIPLYRLLRYLMGKIIVARLIFGV
jgi:hypothetical protein